MPKGKAKKKTSEPAEPDHDPAWERSVISGVWNRPCSALPDAHVWPTWGALRERVLLACKKIQITYSPTLRNAFPRELARLSPSKLTELEFRGSQNLQRFVLSPFGSCEQLAKLDLSECTGLSYVFIQSESLTDLNLSHCKNLSKANIELLTLLTMPGCERLQTLMIWSDHLESLVLDGANNLHCLKLHCPSLTKLEHPLLKVEDFVKKTNHPPICDIVLSKNNFQIN